MSELEFDMRDTMSRFMDDKQAGKSHLLGPSSVGKCYRQAAYRYFGTTPSDYRDKDKADLGTLLHLGWSAMIRAAFDPTEREGDVELAWPELPRNGEADDVDWKNRIVTDLKSSNDRSWQAMVDRGQPYPEYWDQAEVYGLSLHRLTGQDWTLRIVLINTDKGTRVEFTQPADPVRAEGLVAELARRHRELEAAVAVPGTMPEDFPQEGKGPGRGFPCDWCPFVTRCWSQSMDEEEATLMDEGVLSPQSLSIRHDAEKIAEMAEEYRIGADLEAEGKRRKYDAQAFLRGLVGTYGDWKITQVGGKPSPDEPDVAAMIDRFVELGEPVPMQSGVVRRPYPKVTRARR